jgi:hypothetical protein
MFKLFGFQLFRSWAYLMKVILRIPDEGYSENTWWRLFWEYLMKVILSIPDEGYSENTWWRLFWAYQMKVILRIPDEGYSEHTWWRLFWAYLMKVILSIPDEGYSEHTWWRLFQKHVMHTKSDIYIFIMGYDPNYEISHIWKITEYFIFHPILVHVCFLNWLYWDLAVKWQQSFTISDLYNNLFCINLVPLSYVVIKI